LPSSNTPSSLSSALPALSCTHCTGLDPSQTKRSEFARLVLLLPGQVSTGCPENQLKPTCFAQSCTLLDRSDPFRPEGSESELENEVKARKEAGEGRERTKSPAHKLTTCQLHTALRTHHWRLWRSLLVSNSEKGRAGLGREQGKAKRPTLLTQFPLLAPPNRPTEHS
jgi:hypothetical protein